MSSGLDTNYQGNPSDQDNYDYANDPRFSGLIPTSTNKKPQVFPKPSVLGSPESENLKNQYYAGLPKMNQTPQMPQQPTPQMPPMGVPPAGVPQPTIGQNKRIPSNLNDWQIPNQDRQEILSGQFGKRPDGENKGYGFYGPIRGADGVFATEINTELDNDGKPISIPMLAPGMSREQINFLMSSNNPDYDSPVGVAVVDNARKQAISRMQSGKSPYIMDNEQTLLNSKTPEMGLQQAQQNFAGGGLPQSLNPNRFILSNGEFDQSYYDNALRNMQGGNDVLSNNTLAPGGIINPNQPSPQMLPPQGQEGVHGAMLPHDAQSNQQPNSLGGQVAQSAMQEQLDPNEQANEEQTKQAIIPILSNPQAALLAENTAFSPAPANQQVNFDSPEVIAGAVKDDPERSTAKFDKMTKAQAASTPAGSMVENTLQQATIRPNTNSDPNSPCFADNGAYSCPLTQEPCGKKGFFARFFASLRMLLGIDTPENTLAVIQKQRQKDPETMNYFAQQQQQQMQSENVPGMQAVQPMQAMEPSMNSYIPPTEGYSQQGI